MQGCAVTSATALVIGAVALGPKVPEPFGSVCSAIALSLGRCSATLFLEGVFLDIS